MTEIAFESLETNLKALFVECPYLIDSVQSVLFLPAHFLTFICFLSVPACFDLVTVC